MVLTCNCQTYNMVVNGMLMLASEVGMVCLFMCLSSVFRYLTSDGGNCKRLYMSRGTAATGFGHYPFV